jgi:lysophospholipase L1-like esterase
MASGRGGRGVFVRTLAGCGLAAALTLAAGGCDGDSSLSADATKMYIGDNDPSTVIAFGDSISDGYDSSNGQGYRDDLASLLSADGRGTISVLDEGEPGTYSGNGAERIASVLQRDRPAAMVLLYGTNDEHSQFPQQLAYDIPTTSENLRAIIAAARANNTVVVLSTIPPVCTQAREFQRNNIVTMNEKIRAIGAELGAADNGVLLADAWEAFIAAAPPDGCALINLDHGNHPNEQGYTVLGQTYHDALRGVWW